MIVDLTCLVCFCDFQIVKTEKKSSNGAYIYVHPDTGYRVMSKKRCHDCFLNRQREKWSEADRKKARQYEKTVNGFLMRAYRNMLSRVTGIQPQKNHLYLGKHILSKQQFYDWSKNNKTFQKLYKQWLDSGHERRLTPSVDRIDSEKGYSLSNMRWLTLSENSRLGALSKKRSYTS